MHICLECWAVVCHACRREGSTLPTVDNAFFGGLAGSGIMLANTVSIGESFPFHLVRTVPETACPGRLAATKLQRGLRYPAAVICAFTAEVEPA